MNSFFNFKKLFLSLFMLTIVSCNSTSSSSDSVSSNPGNNPGAEPQPSAPVIYSLTVNAANGTVAVSPTPITVNGNVYKFLKGTSVTLTPTESSGYGFSCWTGDNTSATSPLTFSMDTDKTVTANFVVARFVKTDGDDINGDGTMAKPFQTISKAISDIPASTVAEIRIAAGTYTINAPISMVDKVSIKGGYNATNWNDRKYFTIDDRNNNTYKTSIERAVSGSISYTFYFGSATSNDTYVEGLYIIADKTSGVTANTAIRLETNASPTIQYNTIEGGNSNQYGYGVYVNAAAPIIKNNKIIGTTISAGANPGPLGFGIFLTNNSAGTIEGNEITGASITGSVGPLYSFGIHCNSSSTAIFNNKINAGTVTTTADINAKTFGVKISNSATPTIYNNYINGGTATNINTLRSSTYAIFLDVAQTNPTVFNNTIEVGNAITSNNDGESYGVYSIMQTDDKGIYENNIVYCSDSSSYRQIGFVFMEDNILPLSVKNNDVYGCVTGLLLDNESGIVIYTIQSTFNSRPYTSGNVVLDPSFTNTAAGNYTLQNIPDNLNVRGGGRDWSSVTTKDILGTTRTTTTPTGMTNINATGWSMGAYEID